MTKKNIFPVVATIAVVGVVLGVFSMTVMRDSNVSISTMTSEQAYANLSSKMKRIGVQEVKVNPQQLDVSEFLDAKDELPDIESSYPFVVVGNGDVNIEIFSSGEKAAESGSDSFLTEMAKKFNAQHNNMETLNSAFPAFLEMHENTKRRLQAVGSSLPASIGF